jgi:predicted secreted hydrolase
LRSGAALLVALALGGCKPQAQPVEESDLAVLAQGATGYAQAQPGMRLEFPRDHGSHPDFRIEWWYLTANLEDPQGRPYGLQWTLFRYAVEPPGQHDPGTPWQEAQLFMAHLGLTTPDDHVSFQRYARGGDHGGVAQAGVTASPFAAWLDDWSLHSMGPEWLPLEVFAWQDDYVAHLELASDRPLVLQGDGGFSQKHPLGGGSHYYSQPFLNASGYLRWRGEMVEVSGQAWLDREWSSQFLRRDQLGWDWFALHLDSGEKLMLFRLRTRGDGEDYRHGVLIAPDGGKRSLDPAQIRFEVLGETTVARRLLPLHWRIGLPEIDRSLEVTAVRPDQWMDVDFPYWEGAVTVRGAGPANRGRGYLELTGYAPQ